VRVYEAFETSEKLTKEGRKCDIIFAGKTIAKVCVRPADLVLNPAFRRETERLAPEIRKEREGDNGNDAGVAYFKLFYRTVIVSIEWMDPADKKDPKLKFTEENMIQLFTKAPKFFSAIQTVALQWSYYKAEFEEETAGN